MGVIVKLFNHFGKESKTYKLEREKDRIVKYLQELQKLEAKLWGVIITDLKNGEEIIVEDSNHLVYMLSRGKYEDLNTVLKLKSVQEFLNDIEKLKKDFMFLKKELREKNSLKLLISNFTIKLVDAKNYEKFKDVFLHEKNLYDVLDKQDEELSRLVSDLSKVKVNTKEEKVEVFLNSLKKVRDILSGHLDNYKYFEEDRAGFSNTSNIIYELIKIFEKDID